MDTTDESVLNEHCETECFESDKSTPRESKKLTELNGEIGWYKNQVFVPMTNFAVRCT